MLQIEQTDVSPSTVILKLAGRLLLGPSGEQLEQLVRKLLSEGRRNFIFDLAELTHIDSTGIGRFIASYGTVYQVHGQIRMAGATGAVRDAFRVTRLDSVFRFLPSVEEAQASLS